MTPFVNAGKIAFAVLQVRRYLSWIEGLTTNQYVGGSNPSRRTTKAALFVFKAKSEKAKVAARRLANLRDANKPAWQKAKVAHSYW